jgi:hypothetical protein
MKRQQKREQREINAIKTRFEYAIVQTPDGLEMRQIGSVVGSIVQMIQGEPTTVLRVVGKMTPAEAGFYWKAFCSGMQMAETLKQ